FGAANIGATLPLVLVGWAHVLLKSRPNTGCCDQLVPNIGLPAVVDVHLPLAAHDPKLPGFRVVSSPDSSRPIRVRRVSDPMGEERGVVTGLASAEDFPPELRCALPQPGVMWA